MSSPAKWTAALAEHDTVVAEWLATMAAVPPDAWHRPMGEARWSHAALALHVCATYEFGIDAAVGGPGMRLRTHPAVAWLSRTLLFPLMLATRRFPRGAPAPREVIPDLAEAARTTPAESSVRLQRVSRDAADTLHEASTRQPAPRIMHAYFGALTPHQGLRLLSAHTRHHTAGLRASIACVRTATSAR